MRCLGIQDTGLWHMKEVIEKIIYYLETNYFKSIWIDLNVSVMAAYFKCAWNSKLEEQYQGYYCMQTWVS